MDGVVALKDERARELTLTGGKAANLSRLIGAGFRVPDGFCVTTGVYQALIDDPEITALLDELEAVDPADTERSRDLAGRMRKLIEAQELPEAALAAITDLVDDGQPYVVRSSATAEDLPSASFAGQHDTVLDVSGPEEIAEAVRRCMASLFTDRAVSYRAVNDIAHSEAAMAVVVQRMIDAESSGVLFTADPTSGRRNIACIDAAAGLGEAVVSGTVTADSIQVDRNSGNILQYRTEDDDGETEDAVPGGGRVLDEGQIAELVEIGTQIERLFAFPQDIEWSFAGGQLWVLQSRPITTLWPVPVPRPITDGLHVYYSWNHRQGMTEVMPPLVVDYWLRSLQSIVNRMGIRPSTGPLGATAGGMVYLDVTSFLTSKRLGPAMLEGLNDFDRQAVPPLEEVLEKRGDEMPRSSLLRGMSVGHTLVSGGRLGLVLLRSVGSIIQSMVGSHHQRAPQRGREWADRTARKMIERIRAGETIHDRIEIVLEANEKATWEAMGQALMLWNIYYYRWRITRLCPDAESEIEPLERGLRENVTTAMMLELGDLTDLARDHTAVEEAMKSGEDLEQIRAVEGGEEFASNLERFLETWGFRAPAEIEFSRPRYHEDPAPLLSSIQASLRAGSRGDHLRHMEKLEREAEEAIEKLMEIADRGLFGALRRRQVKANAVRFRSYLALREVTKYALSQLMTETRRQVLEAGEHLKEAGRLQDSGDVWYLTFSELLDALQRPDEPTDIDMGKRRLEFAQYRQMRPARVITSDGEIPRGDVGELSDADGFTGVPTSGGVAEGVARVVYDPSSAVLEAGEILVAPHTDPGWTPLFLNAAGLVTNVGGLMTHGSLVAREYGIPSVVLADATDKLESGLRIHVDGNRGIVQILDENDEDT